MLALPTSTRHTGRSFTPDLTSLCPLSMHCNCAIFPIHCRIGEVAGGAEAAQGGSGVGNGSGGVSDQGASLVFRCLTACLLALLPPSPWRWHLSMS